MGDDMLSFEHEGNFKKTTDFLKKVSSKKIYDRLRKFGDRGVDALRKATPKDTGLTSALWSYEIEITKSSTTIYWKNSNIVKGVPIAVILQYGHGTATGGYVKGVDYINPALKPIFDEILYDIWHEMTR